MCSNEMSAINITGDTITIARICGFFFFFFKKRKTNYLNMGKKKGLGDFTDDSPAQFGWSQQMS
jgi:hypothetical protein